MSRIHHQHNLRVWLGVWEYGSLFDACINPNGKCLIIFITNGMVRDKDILVKKQANVLMINALLKSGDIDDHRICMI